tara:strand:- start:1052 stop:1258 length:207 start_codon:yes stop_codon:yes gene_type:complete
MGDTRERLLEEREERNSKKLGNYCFFTGMVIGIVDASNLTSSDTIGQLKEAVDLLDTKEGREPRKWAI